MDDRPRYMISRRRRARRHAPADAAHLRGEGARPAAAHAGKTRLYSEPDLERLRLIQRLTTELGLNLAGVERVLALEDELARLRARVERLEREMREEIDAGAPAVPARARPLPSRREHPGSPNRGR